MPLRDYLRRRRLSFALLEVRDTQRSFLDIAVDYGFGSHEAFTRAFKQMFGVTPGRVAYFYFDPEQYEKRIRPVVKR